MVPNYMLSTISIKRGPCGCCVTVKVKGNFLVFCQGESSVSAIPVKGSPEQCFYAILAFSFLNFETWEFLPAALVFLCLGIDSVFDLFSVLSRFGFLGCIPKHIFGDDKKFLMKNIEQKEQNWKISSEEMRKFSVSDFSEGGGKERRGKNR